MPRSGALRDRERVKSVEGRRETGGFSSARREERHDGNVGRREDRFRRDDFGSGDHCPGAERGLGDRRIDCPKPAMGQMRAKLRKEPGDLGVVRRESIRGAARQRDLRVPDVTVDVLGKVRLMQKHCQAKRGRKEENGSRPRSG